jgi:hypothetical protein
MDERIINKKGWICGLDMLGSGYGLMAGSWKRDDDSRDL